MKLTKYLLALLSFTLLFSVNIFAQDDEDISTEEWEAEMARLKERREQLNTELTTLRNDVNNLKSGYVPNLDSCKKELASLIGATQEDIDNFRRAVTELDGKIQRREGAVEERQADLDALKTNRISALPEFFDKVHNQMQAALDRWNEDNKAQQEQTKEYTVVKGDHLWGIAKKPEHYGNPFAWPHIYNANRDQIKNPDLIFPKQVFKIPSLTEEEKAKYDKLRGNYKPTPVR